MVTNSGPALRLGPDHGHRGAHAFGPASPTRAQLELVWLPWKVLWVVGGGGVRPCAAARVLAMLLPRSCHALAMFLPCSCHVLECSCHVLAAFLPLMFSGLLGTGACDPALRRGHFIAMLSPCSCHFPAMLLPCSCHALATLLPCSCHVLAIVLPCMFSGWLGTGGCDPALRLS